MRADLDELVALTAKLAGLGVQDLVLELPAENPAAALQYNTVIRKAALKASFKPLGYPILNFVDRPAICRRWWPTRPRCICKYASILVVDTPRSTRRCLPLMTLRQNIYTDPQKPIQVEPKVYPIGEPERELPGLRHHQLLADLLHRLGRDRELRRAGAWLVVECEGMSVLTAWAAGKFSRREDRHVHQGQSGSRSR